MTDSEQIGMDDCVRHREEHWVGIVVGTDEVDRGIWTADVRLRDGKETFALFTSLIPVEQDDPAYMNERPPERPEGKEKYAYGHEDEYAEGSLQ
jgi:hypothetical protein